MTIKYASTLLIVCALFCLPQVTESQDALEAEVGAPSAQGSQENGVEGDLLDEKVSQMAKEVADQIARQLSKADVQSAATFVADVTIPDGTLLDPGQSFTKTWRIRNTGTTNWVEFNLVFVDGDQMSAPPSVPVPMTEPGEVVDISVPMTAPMDVGRYKGNWRMHAGDEGPFGGSIFVLILVQGSIYEGRTLEEWSEDLQAPSQETRVKAVEALVNFGPAATPTLIKVSRDDPDDRVRGMALGALADVRPLSNDILQVLLEAAADPAPSFSRMAAIMFVQEALPSRLGPDAVPALVESLSDETNAMKRRLAVGLLAHLGPAAKEAVPTLRELSDRDPAPEVRSSANRAVALIDRKGVISDGTYSSAREWFSVPLPSPSNPFGLPFAVHDESVNDPDNSYDLVSFVVSDTGEALITGVRRIPDDVPDELGPGGGRAALSDLAATALRDWRRFEVEPRIVDETYLHTQHGESLLRVYSADKASLIVGASGERPNASDTFDTLIAVVGATRENHYVYAIVQNDLESDRTNGDEALKRRVLSFYNSVVVHITRHQARIEPALAVASPASAGADSPSRVRYSGLDVCPVSME